MPVPSSINDLSTTAGSNSPAGSEGPQEGDNYIRALSSFIATLRDKLNGTSDTGTIKNGTFSGTMVGAAAWAGLQTFAGGLAVTNGAIDSGTYTPTGFNVLNVANATMRTAHWIRVGNVVTVSGQCDIDPTAGSAFTLGITLPIATVMDFGYRLNGTMGMITGGIYGTVFGDAANERASLTCPNNTTTANDTWCYHFTYLIQS